MATPSDRSPGNNPVISSLIHCCGREDFPVCDSTPFTTTSKDKSLQITAQYGGGRYFEAFTHMPQSPQILPWTNFKAKGKEEKLASLPGS